MLRRFLCVWNFFLEETRMRIRATQKESAVVIFCLYSSSLWSEQSLSVQLIQNKPKTQNIAGVIPSFCGSYGLDHHQNEDKGQGPLLT